ncbi:uncharacterized protein LOC115058366 [Echeneis naucrates]|uniref:uncharacterized protein LOC115058366 n=1 Tax=Echeneis naucrates TaxID=173247 RepID=UPI001113677E|nr:uncharacterized protein LOC115058366 [Echeneis naucrates]
MVPGGHFEIFELSGSSSVEPTPSIDGSESVDVDSGGFQLFGGRSSAWRFLYEAASLCFIFGKPIRVTVNVKDPSSMELALFVLSPLSPEDTVRKRPDHQNPEVCLAAGFRPQQGEMVLNVENGSVSLNTSRAVLSREEKSFFFAGLINETIYSCELHGASADNEDIDRCDNFPEGARLNFYLLLMNGIRLVFTKTLAFNTVLTIRAVLF